MGEVGGDVSNMKFIDWTVDLAIPKSRGRVSTSLNNYTNTP